MMNMKMWKTICLLLVLLCSINAGAKKSKPNIVFIVVDDLGYSDIGFMNQKDKIETPNIDALAQSGMVFTNAYASAPVCSPTRASLITGKYPATVKMTCHIPGMGMEKYIKKLSKGQKLKEAHFLNHLPLDEPSIGRALKEQGYSTAYIGKWHLGGAGSAYSKDGIINSDYHPENYGFDINIGGCAYGQPKSYFSPYRNGTLADGPEGEYLTDRLADEAVHFIKEHKNEPFFLNLATYTVHTPLQAPTDVVEYFGGDTYVAMIKKLDENVGKVINEISESGLSDNTIVILYSDNGGLWGNPPLKGIKGTLNEGGIRVPLIASWPKNIKAGQTCDVPVTSVDFFPTMLQLAGGSTSDYPMLEGQSLIPLFKEKRGFSKRSIYWHFPHHRKEGLSMGAAIRRENWKYIIEFETEKEYLYDLDKDPTESENVAASFPSKLKELRDDLVGWQKSVDVEMPELNNLENQ